MKKQYTEMITSLRRAHKRSGLSYAELEKRSEKIIAAVPEDEQTLRKLCVAMEFKYERGTGECCHIFMPDRRFCEWLSDCAQTLDPELGVKAAEGFGSNFVCLHFPCGSDLPSALLAIGCGNRAGGVVLDYSMTHPLGGCAVFTKLDGRKADAEARMQHLNPDAQTSLETRQQQANTGEFYTRMIAGLGLYMSCFPEQVRDGIPADAKRAEYAAGHAKTIGVSETVVCREGVTPHYRSGHFRLLVSERYVNKRGQVVFIHGCFVKGQAKTVLSPETAGV